MPPGPRSFIGLGKPFRAIFMSDFCIFSISQIFDVVMDMKIPQRGSLIFFWGHPTGFSDRYSRKK